MNGYKIPTIVAAIAGLLMGTQLHGDTFGSGPNQFAISFVDIDYSGNSSDSTGKGDVSYNFRIGVHEVSRVMIDSYNASGGSPVLTMASLDSYGGNGTDRPATGINWNEAARFVNWLNSSQGYQEAYQFTTNGRNDDIVLWSSSVAWQAGGENRYRHKDARYFLPSENEWYKSAYYNPNSLTYADYATGSNTAPIAVLGGTTTGTAVYNQPFIPPPSGPSDITNAGGLSTFGTMAQNGNVFELMESSVDGINNLPSEFRVTRGGGWSADSSGINAANRNTDYLPDDGSNSLGFRVASVCIPEIALANYLAVATTAGLGSGNSAPTDIPFNDGVENILKYAFNMDLSGPDVHSMMLGGISGLPWGDLIIIDGLRYWRFEYLRRKGCGLDYEPEISTNLFQWMPPTGIETITNIDSEWERVSIDTLYNSVTKPRCFGRVRVSLP